MSLDIDRLNIEVTANADKADQSLDRLIATLEKLKTTSVSIKGVDKLVQQMNKLSQLSNALNSLGNVSSQVGQFVNGINQLNNISVPSVTKLTNTINRIASASKTLSNVNIDTSKTRAIADVFKPFETMGKNNINSFLKSVEKLPQVAKILEGADMDSFAASIQKTSNALAPLAQQIGTLATGFNSLPQNIRRLILTTDNLTTSNNKAKNSYSLFGKTISAFKVHLATFLVVGNRLANVLGEAFDKSNEYVENLNLFSVAMGESTKSALEFADTVNKVLGIDSSEFIRNWGIFKQITSGFGVVEEKANLMSKNLTQIGYDISSFYNIGIEEAMQKVQSGISGELEPLRRLGYALDAATLQQIAYKHGVEQSINTMTQAQKSQLRYLAIIEQSKNVMNDMARTVITPANSIRITQQLITQLQRQLGNLVSIFAVKVIPYLQVFIRLLTDAAEYLANKWGFELPEIDYSGMSNGLSSAVEDTENLTDGLNETAKAVQRLAGFDELNILPSPDKSGYGYGNGLENAFDLGIELPEYDFLKGADNTTEAMYQKVKKKLKSVVDMFENWGDILKDNEEALKLIAGIIIGSFVGSKLAPFVEATLKMATNLKNGHKSLDKLSKVKITTITSSIGAISGFNFGQKIGEECDLAIDSLWSLAGVAGSVAAAFALTGPLGAAVTAVTSFVGVIGGLVIEMKKAKTEADKAMTNMYQQQYILNQTGVSLDYISDVYTNYVDNFEKRTADYTKVAEEWKTANGYFLEAEENFNSLYDKIKLTPDAIGEADFTALKQSLDDLYSYTQQMVDKEVQIIVKGVKDSFNSLSETMDIDKLSADFYLLQNDMNKALADSKQKADSYVNQLYELQKGGKGGSTEYDRIVGLLGEEVSKIATLQSNDTDFVADFNTLANELVKNFGKVDIANISSLETFLNSLEDEFKIAESGIAETYRTQMSALNSLKSQLDKLGLEYDKQMFASAEASFVSARDNAYADLYEKTKSITGQINVQISGAYDKVLNAELDKHGGANSEMLAKNRRDAYNMANSVIAPFTELIQSLPANMIGSAADVIGSYNYYSSSTPSTADRAYQSQINVGSVDKTILEQLETSTLTGVNNWFALQGKQAGQYFSTESAKAVKNGQGTFNSNASTVASGGMNVMKSTIDGSKQGIVNTIKNIATSLPNNVKNAYSNSGKSLGSYFVGSFGETFKSLIDMLASMMPGSTGSLLKNSFSGAYAAISKINAYATGGMPSSGEIFIANENGNSELIGRIGNRAAVSNQEQISDSIKAGVLEAMSESSIGGNAEGDTYIFLDSQSIAYAMEKRNRNALVRANGRS